MKKRFLSLGLAVMMAASLTACGGGSKTETSAAAEKTEDSKAADTKAEDTSAAAEGDTTAAAEGETAARQKRGIRYRRNRSDHRSCGSLRQRC